MNKEEIFKFIKDYEDQMPLSDSLHFKLKEIKEKLIKVNLLNTEDIKKILKLLLNSPFIKDNMESKDIALLINNSINQELINKLINLYNNIFSDADILYLLENEEELDITLPLYYLSYNLDNNLEELTEEIEINIYYDLLILRSIKFKNNLKDVKKCK